MVEGLSIITYKGKTIVYVDYSGFVKDKATQKEKTLKLLRGATEEYRKYPPKSVLGLTNVEGLYFDMDVLAVFREEGVKTAPHEKKVAVVGVKGLIKAAYNFVVGLTNPRFKIFDTEQEAKEWLVSE